MLPLHERTRPKDRTPICWKLLTDLPVESLESAIEKANWSTQRWKIETFPKILKSGRRVEEAKLRTASRLSNLIGLSGIVAWRVFSLTMRNRTDPDAAAMTVVTPLELRILQAMVGKSDEAAPESVADAVVLVARLGGYLGRNRDGPPGNMVIWRGLSRLTDIHLGVELGQQLVGN